MAPFCGNSTFWDTQFTFNSSWPKFTQCFQSTALVYGPAAFLWFSSLVYIPYLVTRDGSTRATYTNLTITKTVLSLLLAIGTTATTIKEILKPSLAITSSKIYVEFDFSITAHLASRVVEDFSFILTAVLVLLEKRACIITSGVLFVYWLLLVTCHIIPLYTFIELEIYHLDVFSFSVLIVKVGLVVTQFVLTCFSDVKMYDSNSYASSNECPEVTASFLSRLTFAWMTRLLVSGFKRPIVSQDVWHLNPRDTSEKAISRFTWAWRHYNKRRGMSRQMSWKIAASNRNPATNYDNSNPPYQNGAANGHSGIHVIHDRAPLLGTVRDDTRTQEDDEDCPQQPVNRRSKCSLFRVLVKAFGWEVLVSYFCKMVSDVLQLAGPLLLKILIRHIENKQSEPIWLGYALASFMLLSFWCQTIFYHQHYHLAMTSGMRMKSALLTAIYKKALCLDTSGQRSSPTGEIVNLMSVDCQRVQDLMSYTWMFWSIPLQICLVVYLLWNTIGVPVISGLVLLLLLVPFNGAIAYHQQRLQRQNLTWKDKRIKIISEVLGGIKVIKLYAWEEAFEKKIHSLRDREIALLTKLAWLNAVSISIWTCAPFMVCLVTFVTHVIVYPDLVLTAEMAFVTVALFGVLQFPISFIPELVSFTTQASVSLKRIGRYLCETELDRSHYHRRDMNDCAVHIENGVFTWDPDNTFRLSGTNLEIPRGSFVAVVGPVGCGKSSLLSAILGEMDRLQGSVNISGSTAYVPQTAWIQNCTLRDNILFGYSFNQKRYRKVIDSCALLPDLEMLPGGDQTEIGEKGINLSGGQRQRVSLARSLYSSSDLYLLDDPLSAVDSHVGKHIFKKVMSEKGMLKNKTRIMATNSVHWLPLVDLIVVMQDGRITEYGSYLQLMKRVGHFSQFLLAHLRRHHESESEVDEDAEVREITRKMWEHVESVTSQSEGTTSGEELVSFHKKRLDLISTVNNLQKYPHASSRVGMRKSVISGDFHQTATSGALTQTAIPRVFSQTSITGVFPHTPEMFSQTTTPGVLSQTATPGVFSETATSEKTKKPTKMSSVLSERGFGNGDVVRLTEDEGAETGTVRLGVLGAYVKNIGYFSTLLGFVMFALYQTSSVLASIWLSQWTGDPDLRSANLTSDLLKQKQYILVYGVLGAFQVFFVFIYACVTAMRMVSAAAGMHSTMLDRIMKAPMSFFDTTPIGRIVNRFSRDVEVLDNQLPQIVFMWVTCVFSVTATLTVISINTPIFTCVIVPLFVLYIVMQRFFVPTSRQLKRLESVTRSPIYSHFSETLMGCHVIRAFDSVGRFVQTSTDLIDKNQVFYFAGITANRWLGIWVETIGSLVVFFSAVFSIVTPGVSGAVVGLSVSYALQITQALKWLVRTMSDIETNIVSVERVQEYSQLIQEAPRYTKIRSPHDWPGQGQIVFRHFTTRYRDGLDPVLRGLDCVIHAGEKIGIVGRTGAGKSSLTLALFRLLEADEGQIIIDSFNISVLGLHDLRSKMTVLPQEPVIFSGTLRDNLDPNMAYLDHEIWTALAMSNMKNTVAGMPDGLYSEVGENGHSLSTGQKQLLCLTRALLRRSKLLVLDEPTSSVDVETDALVQATVKKVFKHCTTITIAHRISTILDCHRVMVLDSGSILEFNSPQVLLKQEGSHFYRLAKSDGAV